MKAAYFRQVQKIPLLTARQEIELSRIIRAGDSPNATEREAGAGRRAKDRFARANLRLVLKVAGFYESKCGKLEFDDLVQFGNIGLIRAIEKFDSERGYKFSTYACAWIRQSIQRGIASQSRTIRLPTNAYDDLVKIKKMVALHKASGSTEHLSDEDIAAELGIPFGRYMQMRRVWLDTWSTDVSAKQHGDGEGVSILECLTSGSMAYAPEIEDDEREKQWQALSSAIDQLPPKEREIMVARYGLDGRDPERLSDVGKRLGVSRERIRQIQVTLTNELRSLLT